MKVIIADQRGRIKRRFDPDNEIVIIELKYQDKKNIKNMDPACTLYCSYPDHLDPELVSDVLDRVKKESI